MTSINIQIKGVLHLPDDARNVCPVFITAAQHGNRPVPTSAAGHPHHTDYIHITGLTGKLRDSVDALPDQGLQLLGGACGFGHGARAIMADDATGRFNHPLRLLREKPVRACLADCRAGRYSHLQRVCCRVRLDTPARRLEASNTRLNPSKAGPLRARARFAEFKP